MSDHERMIPNGIFPSNRRRIDRQRRSVRRAGSSVHPVQPAHGVSRPARLAHGRGLNKGWGVAADLFWGAQDEAALNQLMEKNVLTHVFVCPQCGSVEIVNDPQRGF